MEINVRKMKKIIALAFIAALALSCSKKESTYEQDSNIILAEPEVKVIDSAAVTQPVDNTVAPVPAAADSAVVPADTVR